MWFYKAELDECICIADAWQCKRSTLYMTKGALQFLKGHIKKGVCVNKDLTFSYKGHPIYIDDTLNSDKVIVIPSSQSGETIYYSWKKVR